MNENNEVVESADVQPIISTDEKPKASRSKKPRTNVAAGDRTEVDVNILTNLKERPVILELYPEDVEIPVDKDHPLYDRRAEEPLDQAILNDIRERGILDMIKVRRKPGEDGVYEIVDGRTRLRCAKQINRDREAAKKPAIKIMAEVLACSNDLIACELKHIFNEHRNQRDPYGRAEGMFDMLSRGADKHDVAHAFKCNVKTVTRSKKLMSACDEVKEAAKDDVITLVEAYDLADYPIEDQPEMLKKFLESKNALAESINPKRQDDKEEQSSGPAKPAKKQRKSIPWKKVFDLYKGLKKQKFNESKPRHTDSDMANLATLALDFMGGGGDKAKEKFFQALEGIGFQTTPEDGELQPHRQAARFEPWRWLWDTMSLKENDMIDGKVLIKISNGPLTPDTTGTRGWSASLVLDPEERTVYAFTTIGSGTPMNVWHNRALALSVGALASGKHLRDLLEGDEAQAILADLCDQYKGTEWDGRNNVGIWPCDEDTGLPDYTVPVATLEQMIEGVPSYWSAADWLSPAWSECKRDVEDAILSSKDEAAEDAALDALADKWIEADSDAILDHDDVRKCIDIMVEEILLESEEC